MAEVTEFKAIVRLLIDRNNFAYIDYETLVIVSIVDNKRTFIKLPKFTMILIPILFMVPNKEYLIGCVFENNGQMVYCQYDWRSGVKRRTTKHDISTLKFPKEIIGGRFSMHDTKKTVKHVHITNEGTEVRENEIIANVYMKHVMDLESGDVYVFESTYSEYNPVDAVCVSDECIVSAQHNCVDIKNLKNKSHTRFVLGGDLLSVDKYRENEYLALWRDKNERFLTISNVETKNKQTLTNKNWEFLVDVSCISETEFLLFHNNFENHSDTRVEYFDTKREETRFMCNLPFTSWRTYIKRQQLDTRHEAMLWSSSHGSYIIQLKRWIEPIQLNLGYFVDSCMFSDISIVRQ